MNAVKRTRVVVDDSAVARAIGERLRAARTRAGLTQQALAEGRYTKAYISALEHGHAKPSVAALNFLSARLGLEPSQLLNPETARWTRLEADVLVASGRFQEAVDAFETLLPVSVAGAPRAEMQSAYAEALCRLGRGRDAIRPATDAVETFRRLRRDIDHALATYWLAYAMLQTENRAEARSLLLDLVTRLRGGLEAEPDLRVRALMALGSVESADGRFEAAVSFLEEAGELAGDLDDRRRAAYLSILAAGRAGMGDMEGAIRAGSMSLALYRAAGARDEQPVLQNDLAVAYLAVGNIGRAAEYVEMAHRSLPADHMLMAHVLETEAQIALARGDVSGALERASAAIELATRIHNRRALTSALVTQGRAHVRQGDLDSAVAAYESAASVARDAGQRARLQQVLTEWADVLADLGRHAEAFALSREALRAGAPDVDGTSSSAGSRLSPASAPNADPAPRKRAPRNTAAPSR